MAHVYRRSNSSVWQAALTVQGQRVRISTQERDRRAAQKKADAEEERLNREVENEKGMRLLEASARFFSTKDLRPRTAEGYKVSLSHIYEILGDFALPALSQARITHYVNQRLSIIASDPQMRKKGAGNVAVRNDLAFLQSLYSLAKHWEPLILSNPVQAYDKTGLGMARERTRWLRPEEVKKLLDACTTSHHRLFILLAVYTGMRSSEIRELQWSEVDLAAEQIVLGGDRTKNKTGRIIPLVETLCDTLRDTPRHKGSDWVFTNPKTGKPYVTLKTFWIGVQRRSGVKGVRIHDLRHTYASWAKQADMDELTIMAVMGHKTRSMVKRYSHISPEHLRKAAEKMGRVTLPDTQPSDFR